VPDTVGLGGETNEVVMAVVEDEGDGPDVEETVAVVVTVAKGGI
jgi:hypothetical protein